MHNRGLGHFQEDPVMLTKAIDYLNKSNKSIRLNLPDTFIPEGYTFSWII